MPPREHPHRPIAVARERRLHDWRADQHATDRQRCQLPRGETVAGTVVHDAHVSTGQRSNHVRPWAAIHSKLDIGPQSPGS